MCFTTADCTSNYGLAIRRDSPLADTLVVGYADDAVGYITDPKAYEGQEYGAVIVPSILDLPPFVPQTAARLVEQSKQRLDGLT